jgi:microcystin-dependent protein
MACKDCFKNCGTTPSDKCVIYTGDDIPLLGICNGDSVFDVEKIIIEKLLSALDGTGIIPSDITLESCAHLKNQMIGKESNLNNLLQLLIDNHCSLRTLVNSLIPTPHLFDLACLTDLPENPTSDDILQKTVLVLCDLQQRVTEIESTYVKLSEVNTIVNNIINNTSSTVSFKSRMVPFCAIPYFGTLSNFDNTGKGLASVGFDKVFLCNGLNGTPDLRGRVIVGAVANVPGNTLDSEVNPTNPNNITNVNYQLNQKFGKNFHALSGDENGAHTHGVVDAGHDHHITGGNDKDNTGSGKASAQNGAPEDAGRTDKATANITISSAGKGQPHENRQPSIASYYIIHIP